MTPNPNPSPELRELIAILDAATEENGLTVYEHSAAEIGLAVMDCRPELLATLSPQTLPAPGEVERLRAVRQVQSSVEMWDKLNERTDPKDACVAYGEQLRHDAMRLVDALSIKPATSQEGEVTQADRDCAADFADAAELHSVAALLRAGKQDTHDFIAIATSYRLDATPSSPTPATVAAANDEGVALDWRAVAKLAGEHGVRYRTNTALEKFLAAIRPLSQGGGK